MKNAKKIILFIIIMSFFYLAPKSVFAYSKSDYAGRGLCGNFEVAGFHSDGQIVKVSCANTFQEAKNYMQSNGADDLAILTKINGVTTVIDANVALVELHQNPIQDTFDIYTQPTLSFAHTYMSTSYSGDDAVLLDSSTSPMGYVAKILVNDRTGWVLEENYEIVPITWVKSSSYYQISNDSIYHHYVSDMHASKEGTYGTTIGPKPTMLSNGKYYSYDGHYFYTDLTTMIKDNRAGNHNHAVNKNEAYYNYYMYLSNHTKSNYSSVNIDEYVRDNIGTAGDVYGMTAYSFTSRLYGKGAFFYYAQEKYGVNALLSFSLSRNETGNGKSNLAVNKNNGFGLNAVDSNPYANANRYANFASSILGFAEDWVTYGFVDAENWRYYGPQFGNKLSGMNVKYASDVYWSEKMASNYYSFDKAKGMQDYNYYQLGVTTDKIDARKAPALGNNVVYEYPEAEDAVVIIGEVQGENVGGSTTWYKVMSDINIDNQFNRITSGPYNWNAFVYVPAAYIKKINTAKKGYVSPNSAARFPDSEYTYKLLIENGVVTPQVALSTRDANFYRDPSLTSLRGQVMKKDRFVVVYAIAYDKNGAPVSYLVTSDYIADQKEWVRADSLQFVKSTYGRVSVSALSNNNNPYVKVYKEKSTSSEEISGQYNYSIVPVFRQEFVGNQAWFLVQADVTGEKPVNGWVLAGTSNSSISLDVTNVLDNAPVILAENKTIVQGSKWNAKEGVTANDQEDGDLTSRLQVTSDGVQPNVVGTYQVTYQVKDNYGQTVTKTITVTVTQNQKPVITAENRRIEVNSAFEPLDDVKAMDQEDGDITDRIEVTQNTVEPSKTGTYQVTYQVKDSFNQTVTKTIKVDVVEDIDAPVEETGNFYFEYLKEVDGQLEIKGYHAIDGVVPKEKQKVTFELLLENILTGEITKQSLSQITDPKEMSVKVYAKDGKDYTYSWFKGVIDIDALDDGDYRMYIQTTIDKTYAKTLVNNLFFMPQVTMYQAEKSVTTHNDYLDDNIALELIVRQEAIAEKTADSVRNMYNQFNQLEFVDGKLRMQGLSYSYGMNLAKEQQVKREIIFENTKTYQKYRFNAGSITNGPFSIGNTLKDNLDKTRSWFDTTIDLSKLEKGNYAIYIATESNMKDYDELTELLFRSVDHIKWEGKERTYQFVFDKDIRYRIELNVQ